MHKSGQNLRYNVSWSISTNAKKGLSANATDEWKSTEFNRHVVSLQEPIGGNRVSGNDSKADECVILALSIRPYNNAGNARTAVERTIALTSKGKINFIFRIRCKQIIQIYFQKTEPKRGPEKFKMIALNSTHFAFSWSWSKDGDSECEAFNGAKACDRPIKIKEN